MDCNWTQWSDRFGMILSVHIDWEALWPPKRAARRLLCQTEPRTPSKQVCQHPLLHRSSFNYIQYLPLSLGLFLSTTFSFNPLKESAKVWWQVNPNDRGMYPPVPFQIVSKCDLRVTVWIRHRSTFWTMIRFSMSLISISIYMTAMTKEPLSLESRIVCGIVTAVTGGTNSPMFAKDGKISYLDYHLISIFPLYAPMAHP